MNREKRLVKNTIIFAIGIFSTKIISFLLLPLYTHYLSTSDYGFFDLVTTTIGLIIPMITIQLDIGIFRFLLDCNTENEIKKTISTSLLIVILNLLIFNLIYVIVCNTIFNVNYKYVILMEINVTVIQFMFSQIARGLKKNVVYSINSIIITIITIVSNILCLVYFKFGMVSLLYSYVISYVSAIVYLCFKLPILNSISFKLKDKIIRKNMCKYSIPLIPNNISWWAMNVSDRYIINRFLGNSANGIYGVANKLPSIITLFNYIFYLAWQQSSIEEFNSTSKSKYYSNMFDKYMKIQFSTIIILLAFTPLILKFIISEQFYEAYKYIPFLYMGTLFSAFSSFYSTFYEGKKQTKAIAYTSIFGGIINIVFNIFMIPKWGIQAASFSTMISFFIMWILRVYNTRNIVKININILKFSLLTLISIFYIIAYYVQIHLLTILFAGVSIVLFILINKTLISIIIIMLKNKLLSLNVK